ncbi:hypothetical protein ABN763_09945 [Spongiivirga sp. MCCC 1A20706]|uniref:hypothetical protein n=1 Tax=Spongiivirga sp. MCCC 1A20706 TaxID=3160963 RepID=UPI0039772D7E
MRKLLSIIILVSNFSVCLAQEELSITIKEASYKAKESTINLSLTFTNNTQKAIYIVKPQSFLFDKHLDLNNQLEHHGLDIAPFKLTITSNKKCKVSEEGYVQIMDDGSGNQMNLISDLVKIEAGQSESFENIKIERYDGVFCNKRTFSISLTYNPQFYFIEENELADLTKRYNEIKDKTRILNRMLYYSLTRYQSTEKDNFKKLNDLFGDLAIMKSLNGKTYTSNSIVATELK